MRRPAQAAPAVGGGNAPKSLSSTAQAVWNCDVQSTLGMTVGQSFGVTCQGPAVAGFEPQTLSLELPKGDQFRLRILENRKASDSSIELGVTSYTPGLSDLKDVVLTDGVHRIALTGIKFEITSVWQEGEEAKPIPPLPPVTMNWPMPVLIAIGAVILGILLGIAFLLQRRRSKKKFAAWLVSAKTPLSPIDQLSKDLRFAVKERDPAKQIAELERMTRVYLSRVFAEPLMTANAKQILNFLVRRLGRHDKKKLRDRLTPLTVRLFGEFERVGESLAKSQLSSQEALNETLPQVHELVREFGESIRREREKRGLK